MRFSFPFLLSHKRINQTMYQPTQCGVPTYQQNMDCTGRTKDRTRDPDWTRPDGLDQTPDQTGPDQTNWNGPEQSRPDQTGSVFLGGSIFDGGGGGAS
jgi:hypothetical protein